MVSRDEELKSSDIETNEPAEEVAVPEPNLERRKTRRYPNGIISKITSMMSSSKDPKSEAKSPIDLKRSNLSLFSNNEKEKKLQTP